MAEDRDVERGPSQLAMAEDVKAETKHGRKHRTMKGIFPIDKPLPRTENDHIRIKRSHGMPFAGTPTSAIPDGETYFKRLVTYAARASKLPVCTVDDGTSDAPYPLPLYNIVEEDGRIQAASPGGFNGIALSLRKLLEIDEIHLLGQQPAATRALSKFWSLGPQMRRN